MSTLGWIVVIQKKTGGPLRKVVGRFLTMHAKLYRWLSLESRRFGSSLSAKLVDSVYEALEVKSFEGWKK